MRVPRGRGSYDRRIQFFRATVSQDGAGSITRTWSADAVPFASRWAQRTDIPPSLLRDERQEEQTIIAKKWTSFRVPYDAAFFADISSAETVRIKDADGSYYDILTVAELPDTRHRVIDILAQTRTDKAPVAP